MNTNNLKNNSNNDLNADQCFLEYAIFSFQAALNQLTDIPDTNINQLLALQEEIEKKIKK